MKNSLRNESMVDFITRHIDELSGKQTGTRKSKGLIEKNEDAIKDLLKGRDASELTADEMTDYTRLSEYGEALNLKLIELETLKGHLDELQREDAIDAECDRVARITAKRRIFKSGKKLKEDAIAVTLNSDAKLKKKPQQREIEGVTGITKVTVGIAGVTDVVGERDELLKQAITLESILSADPKKISLDDELSARTMLYRIKIQLEKSYSKSVKVLEKDPLETLKPRIESPVIKDDEKHGDKPPVIKEDEKPEDKPPVTEENESPQQAISVGPIRSFIISILNKLKSIFKPNSKMYKLLDKATLSLCSKQNAVLISDGDNKKKVKNIVKQVEQEESKKQEEQEEPKKQEEPKSEVENDEKKDEKKGFFKRIFGAVVKQDEEIDDEEFDDEEIDDEEVAVEGFDDEEIDDEEELEDKIAKEGMTWLADKNKEYARDPEHYLWVEKIYNAKVNTFNCKYGEYGGYKLPFAYSEIDADVSQEWRDYNETAVCDAVESLEIPRIDSWHKKKLDEPPVKELFYYSYARGIIEKAKELDGFSLTDKDGKPKSLETIADEYERYVLMQKTNDVSSKANENQGVENTQENIRTDEGIDK